MESDNNNANLPNQPPVFTPPTDGQGINPPREVEEQPPRPQVNREQIYESWHSSDGQATITSQEQTPTEKDGDVKILNKGAGFMVKAFIIPTGVIFGMNVIGAILQFVGDFSFGGLRVAIISFLTTIPLVICAGMLFSASNKIIKFNEEGRVKWLRVSLVLSIITLISLAYDAWMLEQAAHSLSSVDLSPQLRANLWAEYFKRDWWVLSRIVVAIIGWIILTRKSVKAWFD